jgi:hypothetical protein
MKSEFELVALVAACNTAQILTDSSKESLLHCPAPCSDYLHKYLQSLQSSEGICYTVYQSAVGSLLGYKCNKGGTAIG